MIPNVPIREIESYGVSDSATFGISLKDSAHIMTILRDTLYSDKVLAVLREYASNAWDAHRMVGKENVPIKVVLPTLSQPTLVIQDFGPGLSHNDVYEVYTQYGASTKRGSDIAVGMLGIGSKSGFAYSDSFTIVSAHQGIRRTYVAVLDESEKGRCDLLYQEECGEDSGVTIKIPVKPEDIYEFANTAKDLFKYFIPRPDINITLPPVEDLMILKNGALYTEDGEKGDWTAVMGCVPYRVNLDQLTGPNLPDGGIPDFVQGMSGVLFFGIGEVHINASREELKYSGSTKLRLVEKVNALVEEFVRHTLNEITTSSLDIWEKRIRAQILNRMSLPIPDELKDLTCTRVTIPRPDQSKGELPYPFIITTHDSMEETHGVYVATDTRFVIRDTGNAISGYGLRGYSYIVRPRLGATVDVVKAELDKLIEKFGLKGIPVLNISSLTWNAPIKPASRKANKKHKVSTFVMDPTKPFCHPFSDVWNVEEREPTPDDVFVILHNFRTQPKRSNPQKDIYYVYKEDRDLAEAFELTLPKIYGYKSTPKKPVQASDCVGTEYFKWRESFMDSLLALPKVQKAITNAAWVNVLSGGPGKKACNQILTHVGRAHPVYQFLLRHHKNLMDFRKVQGRMKRRLKDLETRAFAKQETEAKQLLEELYTKYPLLKVSGGWSNSGITKLWGEDSKKWLHYITLVDNYNQLVPPTQVVTPALEEDQEVLEEEEIDDDDASVFDD